MAHGWLWAGLFAVVLGAIALDLGVHRHQRRALTLAAATGWSALWIALALGYGALVWWRRGGGAASEFYTAWLLEKSLSFDNLLLFLLVFQRLQVPANEHHRVLTWGILGALVLRGAMIFGGVELLAWWHPIMYVFGAFLALSGAHTLVSRDDHHEPRWLAFARRHFPSVPRFFLALVIIELADVMFAVDSIPAVLGVTRDLQIVFSSNVLAILGLRALYSVVERLVGELRYLRYGVGAILVLVGAKMCLDRVVHVPALVSLAVTVGILAITAAVSLLTRRPNAPAPTPPRPAGRGARDALASSPARRAAAEGHS
jgi:tellurite resistance protein TerC